MRVNVLPDRDPERREPRVYGVSELNALAAEALRRTLGWVHVVGEISKWTVHRSGHAYVTLKDERGVLDAVVWASRLRTLRVQPSVGDRIVAVGRLTVYSEQGRYQLMVERVRPAGAGALQEAHERLKARLTAEGLFAPERKRPLPRYPRVVGVVTSADGAAFGDVVRVIGERWPGTEILLTPVRVQGPDAPRDIVNAIGVQIRHGRAEVLIVGRGGGSLEDLFSFNDERVVRAIATCPLPVVSAVGHETDVTLADFAADARAATPSQAAERVVADRAEVVLAVLGLRERLLGGVQRRLTEAHRTIREMRRHRGLDRPQTAVEHLTQRVDRLGERLTHAVESDLADRRAGGRRLGRALGDLLASRLVSSRRDVVECRARLVRRAERLGIERRPRVAELSGMLTSLDPTRVLARGYALCATEDGTLVTDGSVLAPEDRITLRFHRGGAQADVLHAWGDTPPRPGTGTT